MGREHTNQKLALQGGMKAVSALEGRGKPKIGVEEFMSVAERFGLSKKTLRRVRAAVEQEDWGAGPFLANYYSNLKETKVRAYEREARSIFGSKYAIGVSSGTAALHSAFVAAGVGPGAEVICSAIGFFATAAAVVQSKGVPVFCDVEDSLHMDPAKIAPLITPRTVAIAVTHVMGGVANMPAIMAIARKHKLKVVEDCAQSCAAQVRGRFVGTYGDLGCFSISAYKIVGGGEGGLVLTNNLRLWERAQGVIECGGLWRPDRFAPPRYEGELFCGTNYRMSELEAAVDVVQIRKAVTVAKRFNAVKRRILRRLKTYREITPQRSNDVVGEVGYTLRFYPETFALGARIVKALRAEGVGCGMRGPNAAPDWHIYHQMQPLVVKRGATTPDCSFQCPHYRDRRGYVEYARGTCPVADDLFDRMITVGLNQWMTARDCQNTALGINKVLSAYCTVGAGPEWL